MSARLFLALSLVPAVLVLTTCNRSEGTLKVLIGATAITEAGAQPIDDSIIVIAGMKIRSVGARKDIPVPQASDRTDLTGKWVVPAPGFRIAPRESANLLVLDRAPNGVSPASPRDIGARIVAGEWEPGH
jgi:hypothetical protein